MKTGSGITGWSTACIDEHARHVREAENYRDIYRYYGVVCGEQSGNRGQFAFLYKKGERLGSVIGPSDYVVNLHRIMQSRDVPSTVGIIRPEVRA